MIVRIEIKNNAIYVDGNLFDFEMDEEGLRKGLAYTSKEAIESDVQKYFTESFSDFVGKEMTLKEINDAIEKGEL